MKPFGRIRLALGSFGLLLANVAHAHDGPANAVGGGVSALWILSNFCYAGMRAQRHPSTFWRILSFIFGLPGTLLSFFLIVEGSERVYGVELPKRRQK